MGGASDTSKFLAEWATIDRNEDGIVDMNELQAFCRTEAMTEVFRGVTFSFTKKGSEEINPKLFPPRIELV